MHDTSTPQAWRAAQAARSGTAQALAELLRASRGDTLATFDAYERCLPGLQVPRREELNPPLWELGHIGWFQEFWLARNPQRLRGNCADPEAPRAASLRPEADALYNSSRVPHASRWHLALPDAAATRSDLARQFEQTLKLLERSGSGDEELYFFRLALLHEDMHHEAALYMARLLGIRTGDSRWRPAALPEPPAPLRFAPGDWTLGSEPGSGFAFDNELCAHPLSLGATEIDAQAVRWAEYLPFVEAGGYADERFWDEAGRDWLARARPAAPLHLRFDHGTWLRWLDGEWTDLDLGEAACHLTLHEAQAWCRWADRRLPSEADWERAALMCPDTFRWGDVWEWSASPFGPFPGFRPHPYRDYSAPWFDGRPVLRGASFMTQPRMRHPRYRNYFLPHRSDVPTGFRSCAR